MIKNRYHKIDVSRKILPILISDDILSHAIGVGKLHDSPILSVVVGTKPDFYKQAPLVVEAAKENMPILVIDTGQHFDDTLGFGIKEFELQRFVGCNLQIRGDLMEKASELITKFGYFGRYCKKRYGIDSQLLPLVHGDTLVAGIAPLAWVFGMGQKVAQNEAGLRSMSPEAMKKLKIHEEPTRNTVEKFINEQFEGKWFLTLEEPFPEQIDTWICSAGTKYFFAPTEMNKSNLVREGYPEDFIHVVGNSVVDAIHITRKQKVRKSIFDIYPNLESGQWIRVDIHRRENLTHHRFTSIVRSLVDLVKKTQFKVNLIMLNATEAALVSYGLDNKIKSLAEEYSHRFLITPVWKQYGHVIEFLDSGHCWAEMTDSGSMQEELLYFPDVLSLTLRLNTDRPETILNAKSNILVPPVSSEWILSMIDKAYNRHESLGIHLRNKKRIFGEPGKVSKQIIRVLKREFEEGVTNFYPWLHQRINLWKEDQTIDYL